MARAAGADGIIGRCSMIPGGWNVNFSRCNDLGSPSVSIELSQDGPKRGL